MVQGAIVTTLPVWCCDTHSARGCPATVVKRWGFMACGSCHSLVSGESRRDGWWRLNELVFAEAHEGGSQANEEACEEQGFGVWWCFGLVGWF